MKPSFVLILVCALGALAADPEAEHLPPGAAREIVARVCSECHGTENFRKKRLSKDDWGRTVDQMVDEGAKATDDEVTAIVEYLGQNFGKESKVWVNSAPLSELKNVLGFTNEEANAVLAWRAQKGEFHSVDDLRKVPGLDLRKVEAKQELIAF